MWHAGAVVPRLTDRRLNANSPSNGSCSLDCSLATNSGWKIWRYAAFDGIWEAVGLKAVTWPPWSPNWNVPLARGNRSVKEEGLSKRIWFGEASLRPVRSHYVSHFHTERHPPGKGNVILFPEPADRIGQSSGKIITRQRLGGLLKFYSREAA